MAIQDVILTIFSNSSQAPYSKWAQQYFSNPPLILTVPGNGGLSFRSQIQSWAKTGDVFAAAVKQLAPKEKIEVGRRALCTFSAGWGGGEELLNIEQERNKLDAYLLLDGCHNTDLLPWIEYAKLAAAQKAIFIEVHSSIIPPNFPSTTSTNSKIYQAAKDWICVQNDLPYTTLVPPDYVLQPELVVEGLKISLGAAGNLPAITKIWTKDPLKCWENVGNLTRLHYTGNDRPDHCYIAWYAAERVFRWLGEEWS